MVKIKFNDLQELINVEFRRDENDYLSLYGEVPQDTSGFIAYNGDGDLLGDYSDYTTVYRVLENGIEFSNDGSQWVEPTNEIEINAIFDYLGPDNFSVTYEIDGVEKEIVLNKNDRYKKIISVPESKTLNILYTEELENYSTTFFMYSIVCRYIGDDAEEQDFINALGDLGVINEEK